ncbi:hypothetical protein [Akkermansia sp.]
MNNTASGLIIPAARADTILPARMLSRPPRTGTALVDSISGTRAAQPA